MKLKSYAYPLIFVAFTGILAGFTPKEAPKQNIIVYGQADPSKVQCLKDTTNNVVQCYKIEEKVEPTPTPTETQPTYQDYAYRKVSETWGEDYWVNFNKLVVAESNWNPQARNKTSGAYGIPQALPASKIAGLDAYGQIDWMINYVKDRYGDPNTCWQFHLEHGWY